MSDTMGKTERDLMDELAAKVAIYGAENARIGAEWISGTGPEGGFVRRGSRRWFAMMRLAARGTIVITADDKFSRDGIDHNVLSAKLA